MSSDRPGGPADVVPGDDRGDASPQRDDAPAGSSSAGRFFRRGGGEKHEKKGSLLRELPVLLLVAFILAVVVKTFFVQAFFIPSGSMEQTLHGCTGCTGDRVLVNKVPYWFGQPQPGDVVVFKGPDTWTPEITVTEPSSWLSGAMLWLGRTVGVAPPGEDDFVKRVIAVGGQTVQCCDPEGRVTVDGKALDEPYIFQNTPIESRAFGPVTVPQGRLWVMGDHRSASADSRAHIGDRYGGTVGVADVIGKAAVIVWPISRFGLVDSPDIQAAAAAGPSGVDPSGVDLPGVDLPGVDVARVTASTVAPWAIGLSAALPITVRLRRRRRSSVD